MISSIFKMISVRTFFSYCKVGSLRNVSTISSTFKFSDLKINCIDEKDRAKMPDENELLFGNTFSDHMFEVEWTEKRGWGKPLICPLHDLSLHPACKVLHYAQEVFEGLKAFRSNNGKILLFRPDLNITRMLKTAERASFPSFDGEELLNCIKKLVSIEQRWVPRERNCSLYIRPTLIGIEPTLGIGASKKVLLYVITGPVGSYFKSGKETSVSLLADPKYIRAWPGGVGDKKMGCNYAPTLYVQQLAEQQNLHQVLWLYGEDHRLSEVGTMNIFVFLINSAGVTELVTPPLDGTILPGVTRQSILDLVYHWGQFKVSERYITMNEVIEANKDYRLLEIFGTGTACVITPVDSISYLGSTIPIPTLESGYGLYRTLIEELVGFQYGDFTSEWSVPVDG